MDYINKLIMQSELNLKIESITFSSKASNLISMQLQVFMVDKPTETIHLDEVTMIKLKSWFFIVAEK